MSKEREAFLSGECIHDVMCEVYCIGLLDTYIKAERLEEAIP